MKTRFLYLLLIAFAFASCAKTTDLDNLTGRVSALEKKSNLTDAEITELSNAVSQLRAEKDAVDKRISELESLASSNAKEIAELKTQSSTLADEIDRILGLFINRIQSVVVVPTYSDGSVRFEPQDSSVIKFEVSPVSAAKALIGMEGSMDCFIIQGTTVETRSTNFQTFEIVDVRMDKCEELVEVILSPIPEWTYGNGDESGLQARLKIEAFKNQTNYVCKTSTYFTLSVSNPNQSNYSHVCENLTHFPAVVPTLTEDGVFEHWHCFDCNKDYIDPDGRVPFEGNTFRPSLSHRISKAILNKCNKNMPWRDEMLSHSSSTKAVSAVSIIKGIINIASSVKTSKYKKDVKSDLTNINTTVNAISVELETIKAEINELNDKTNQILEVLKNRTNEDKVNETYQKLHWLYKLSNTCIDNLNRAFAADLTDDVLFKEICNIIADWNEKNNYEGESPSVVIKNLLNEFDVAGQSGTSRISFTEVLKEYTRTYRYWDDEGYYDRMQFLRFYQLSADMASYLASLHTLYVADYSSEISREKDWSEYIANTEMLSNRISADSTRMVQAYDHYRVFRNSSRTVYLEINPVSGNMTQWWKDKIEISSVALTSDANAYRYTDDPLSIEDCINMFIESFAGNDFIDDYEINDIYSAGANQGEKSLSAIFAQHGMNMNPHNLKNPILFPNRPGKRSFSSSGPVNDLVEQGEVSGFWCEMKYYQHGTGGGYHPYPAYQHYVDCLKAGNIWMNYSHSDDNVVHKNNEYGTDWFRDLWTVCDLTWNPWSNVFICDGCKYSRAVNDLGDKKNAQYAVTFKHYKGDIYD